MLSERYGTRSTSLESVVKCEHKYWSRLEQQKVIDEHPRFGRVDLEAETRARRRACASPCGSSPPCRTPRSWPSG